ncbi:MAG: hypothetical protein JJE09_07425 [Bacteroidia bacterium]|nr:hypothetical protein [Bacteroidia bacterium]
MKEASRVKYYFAKYFFLALGLLQWFIGSIIFMRSGHLPKSQFAVLIFFTLGLVFVSLFLIIASKIKRVAVSKKKVAVINSHKTQEYEWPEIKSISFLPFFNMYRMKIRGRKGKIYFLPTQESEVIYGIFSSGQLTKN